MSESKQIKKRLVWLVSYPKSGNTWIRLFLSALLNKGQPDINGGLGAIYSSYLPESILDLDMDGLSLFDKHHYRIKAYEYLNEQINSYQFIKVHDSYIHPDLGLGLLPVKSTNLCVYIVRNPLAIAPSLANHMNESIDFVLKKYLTNPKARLSINTKKPSGQMEQFLGTWQSHVRSWTSQTDVSVLVIKYEELKSEPLATFRSLVEALGLSYGDSQIQEAIDNSSFEKMQVLERKIGFVERPYTSRFFFYKGQNDYWKEVLTKSQIDRVVAFNRDMMFKYGYLKQF